MAFPWLLGVFAFFLSLELLFLLVAKGFYWFLFWGIALYLENMSSHLSPSQQIAEHALNTKQRVFLTGGAGTGKSYLIKNFLKDKSPKTFPVLASTGAAAVLVGGRTFHSFFSLGIMEGGLEDTIEKALKDNKLFSRLNEVEGFVIDEVSMISALAFRAAEAICRLSLDPSTPWGGLKVIAVGDFFQLPPVNMYGSKKDWCFLDPSWQASGFESVELLHNMRTDDDQFVHLLSDLRQGKMTKELNEFLSERMREAPEDEDIVHLYPLKSKVESYNLDKLDKIEDAPVKFETIYEGDKRYLDNLKRSAPVPEELVFKIGAFVMVRQNDPMGRFVNGSLGYIRDIFSEEIEVELLNGRFIRLEKTNFSFQDAEGDTVAIARNFPLSLAYATTIHKAQGTSLDRMRVDMAGLWEPGHAYVALSRAKDPNQLYVEGWDLKSVRVAKEVLSFYESFQRSQ